MDFEAPDSDLAAAQVATPAAPATPSGGFEAPEADTKTASVESAATDDKFDPVEFYRQNGKTPEALDFASGVAHARAKLPTDKLKAGGGLAKGVYEELGNTVGDIKDAFTGKLGEAKSGLGGFVQGMGVAGMKAGKSIVTSPKAAKNFETSNDYLRRMHEKISNYDTLLEQERADKAAFIKEGGKPEDYVSPISDEDRVSPEDRAEYDNTAADQYEAAAALRKGALRGGELALKAGRGIKGLFHGGEKALTPEDWKERIATDADIHDTADNLSKAAGMTNKGAAGFFAAKPDLPDSERERLLKQGTISSPEINQMATVADPTNIALGEALRLPGVGAVTGGALRLSGKAASAVGSIADRVIGHGAGRAIAMGGGTIAAYEAGKHALAGDFKPLGLGLALLAARGVLRRGGGLLDDAGREMLDPEGFNSASATRAAGTLADEAASGAPQAETVAGQSLSNFTSPTQNAAAANRIARRTVQGVSMGVAGGLPFAALSDNPEEAGKSLAGGAVFGAAIGPMGGVEGGLDRAMEINKAATTMLAERGGEQNLGDPNLQAAHNAAMADLPKGVSTYLDAMRGLVSGFKGRNGQPMKMAVLNQPDFQAELVKRYGMTPEEAEGVDSHGFYDAKSGTILINKGNLRVDSAGHETGHFITDEVMQQVGRGYGDALRQATEDGLFNGDKPTPEFSKFIDAYNAALPDGATPIPKDKGRADILSNRAVSEYLAETARNILGEPNVGKFILPKDVSDKIADRMADMYGDGVDGSRGKKDIFQRTDLPTIHNALKNVIFDLGRGLRPDPSLSGRRRPAPTEPATAPEGQPGVNGPQRPGEGGFGESGTNPGAENPYEDVGLTPETVEGAKDQEMNMLPVKTKGSGMTATRIVRQREADWNEHLDKYLEYLRTNGLNAPNNPLELHHRVTDFALRSEPAQKYNVIDPREGGVEEPATGGALSPEPASSHGTKMDEPGALAPQEDRGGVMTEQEVSDRANDAEAEAKADPSFSRKRGPGQAAAIRQARIGALLDASHEAAGGDESFLQKRTDAGGNTTYRGRLAPDEVPAHRLLLDELGVTPDGQATIDLLNDHVGQTVYLDYKSAVKTDESDISGAQRREEYAESTPDDRKAGGAHTEQKGKAFFITGFKIWPKKGSITLTGFSPDKWLANAHKLIEHVNKIGGPDVGYENINDPDIALDMQGYTANHTNGWKGDGSAPVEGRTPTPGYKPHVIPDSQFQVLNAALNLDVSTKADSKRPGARENAMEAQYKALENGVPVDEDTGDVNPLRAFINKHGNLTAMNDAKGALREGTGDHLESVYENISPDLVTGLSTTPDGQKIVRPVGFKGDPADITQGGIPRGDYAASGFMPDSGKGALSSDDTKTDEPARKMISNAEDLMRTIRKPVKDDFSLTGASKGIAAMRAGMDAAFHFNTLASRAVMEMANAAPRTPKVVQGFEIWKDAMADVAASLPDIGDRKSAKTDAMEDPYSGVKAAFPGGKEMDFGKAVRKAHDIAIAMMGPDLPGRLTGIHRDYLNMLENVSQMDPEHVNEKDLRDLTEATWGTRKTTSEALSDFDDEMTGSAMLGEVDKTERGGGITEYRKKEDGGFMPDSGKGALSSYDTKTDELGFYSRLREHVNQADFGRSKAKSAGHWLGVIEKWAKGASTPTLGVQSRGIAADELEWSGIKEWLQSNGSKPIKKADVLNFIDHNGIKLSEVQAGGVGSGGGAFFLDDEMYDHGDTGGDGGGLWTIDAYASGDHFGEAAADRIDSKPMSFISMKKPARHEVIPLKNGKFSAYYGDESLGEFATKEEAHEALTDEYGPDEEKEPEYEVWDGPTNTHHETFSTLEEAKRKAQELARENIQSLNEEHTEGGEAGGTQFSGYKLPGGTNYKEIRLALPERNTPEGLPEGYEIREDTKKYGQPGIVDVYKDGKQVNGAIQGSEKARKWIWSKEKPETPFTESHWDEPNVVAHFRQQDFEGRIRSVTEDGKGYTQPKEEKVRHIDEFQSDWHQKGRERGYRKPGDENDPHEAELEKKVKESQARLIELRRAAEAATDTGDLRDVTDAATIRKIQQENEEGHAVAEELRNLRMARQGLVPDAPFKKSWNQLAFKRALKLAVEDGMDRMSWSTGDQNIEHYKNALVAEVQKVTWTEPAGREGKVVTLDTKSSGWMKFNVSPSGVISESGGARIAHQFEGKQLSDVLGKDNAKKIMEPGEGNMSGDGMEVGGNGMRKFYDEIMPNFANKYVSKWGSRVEETVLPTGDSVHSVAITPEMREAVEQGQPMFMPKSNEGYKEAKGALSDEAELVDTRTPMQARRDKRAEMQRVADELNATGDPDWEFKKFGKEAPKQAKIPEKSGALASSYDTKSNETQEEYAHRLQHDPESIVNEHRNPAGVPVLNGDAIIYGAPKFKNAAKEDRPAVASELYPMAKEGREVALKHLLEQPVDKEGAALMMAGGMGSGKSTIAEEFKLPELIYDTNLKVFKDATNAVDSILASDPDRTVKIVLVERDPRNTMRANIKRFLTEDRIGTADDVGSSNALARQNVKKMAEHYAGNERVTFEAYRNNEMGKKAVRIPLSDVEDISVDEGKKRAHDVLNEIEAGTDKEWDGEPITKETANLARGGAKGALGGGKAGDGQSPGNHPQEGEAAGATTGGSPDGDAAGSPGALSGRDSGAGGRVGRFMPKEASSHDTKSDIDPLGFYSGLSRIIKDKLPNRASGEQIMATLKGAGAKQEEMESMGLPEFLKTHEGPVTKQELSDFVKAGGVQLKEVTKQKEVSPKQKAQLEADMDSDRSSEYSLGRAKAEYEKGASDVHSVTITPEMRKAVLEEGQPMFMPKDKNAPVSQKAREGNFKKWTGGAKVIREGDYFDDIKPGEPVVVEGFHGTTHEFDTADPSKGNIESDMGRGFYVTNTPEDVESNYAGEGPDLTNRINLRAERIDSEIEGMGEGEIVESFGVTAKEAKLLIDGEGYSYGSPQAKERNAILKKIAKSYLTKHGGATMKVFVKMKNPLKLGGKEEYWDSEYPEDEEGEITGDPTGKGIEFLEALRHEASHYDSADLDEDKLSELAMEGGRPSEFIKAAKEALQYAEDPGTGDMASSEIVRAALERMGYDGIIDGTVNQKFGSQSRQKAMVGMHEGTFHVIAFHPEQIKSATGNKGTFDPNNPSMNFMPKAKEQAGALSGGGPPSSYHTKRDDEEKRGALAAH